MRIDPLITVSPVTGARRPLTTGLLRDSYLAPAEQAFDLRDALKTRNAPWSDSHAVAPEATARSIESALTRVMRATSHLEPAELRPERLPESRARSHLGALRDLWRDTGMMPDALAVTRHVLRCDAGDCLEPLPLLSAPADAFADPAERALAAALARHHGTTGTMAPAAGFAPGALGHVQASLGRQADATAPDAGLLLFGLRDPREEADFAAALAQSLIDTGRIAAPREIGILAPDTPGLTTALAEAFDRTGLPLSSWPAPTLRDLVGEFLSALLAVLEGPPPRIALATIHASALMPWPAAAGRRMAREIIENGWSRSAKEVAGPGREILDGLRPITSPEQLLARLFSVAAALPGQDWAPRIAALRAALAAQPSGIDWPALHRLAAPRAVAGAALPQMLEGVSLFDPASLPWRPVRHLIVLGLNGANWPVPASASPLFTEGEIALICRETGLPLSGRGNHLARGLELFRRQLCAAAEAATLLVPARGLEGKTLSPSTGLALICHLLGAEEPASLIGPPRLAAVPLTPVAPLPGGGGPVLPESGVLRLGTDLLRLRETDTRAPQSPSRLEKLLYSPLAWALDELRAKDRTWAPESPDVLILGTLIGAVFETAFPVGAEVPGDDELRTAVPLALGEAITRNAPWLLSPHWTVERGGLMREALTSAMAWAGFLRGSGARVSGNEVPLAGDHHGILIAGRADTLLHLPDDRLLLIDHKRASGKNRRNRMAKGWDLQVALYRAMLERPVEGAMQGNPVIGYHNSLDGSVLIENAAARIPGAEIVAEDISHNAMAALVARLAKVGTGEVALNHAGDAKRLEKETGITAYALKDALVAALMLPEPAEEEPTDE